MKEFLIVNIYVLGVMVRWAGLVERVGQGMVCWTPETPNIISQRVGYLHVDVSASALQQLSFSLRRLCSDLLITMKTILL